MENSWQLVFSGQYRGQWCIHK